MSELTLDILDELIKQTKEEIIGFVVHPDDARSLKDGSKVLYGLDDYKLFVISPYKGIAIYTSTLVQQGEPIKLTKQNKLKWEVSK